MGKSQYSNTNTLQKKLDLVAATMKGTIEYGFTNDYMFRAVLQENPVVLAEIVRVLLKIPKNKIVTCEIQNPIILGKSLENKDCILDILVSVNGKALVNLEMQMSISIDWIKRSLYYGFGMYTNLKTGQDYSDCKPSYHIGFVKKSPFKDDERFYSNFLLMEEKTNRIYTRDFQISMINLSHMENATEEDIESGLYDWVRLFKATEWKELMEMAQQSEVLGQAIVTLAELSEEEKIRQQCAARRKYEMDEQATAKRMKKITQELDEMTTQLAEKTSLLTEINNKLMEKDNQLTEKDNQITEKNNQLTEKDNQLTEKDNQLTEKDNQLTEKDNQLTEKDNLLKNSSLREKLTEALVKAGRFDDLKRSIENPDYRTALIEELKLTFE